MKGRGGGSGKSLESHHRGQISEDMHRSLDCLWLIRGGNRVKQGTTYLVIEISLSTTLSMLGIWSEILANAEQVTILWVDIFGCKKQSLV